MTDDMVSLCQTKFCALPQKMESEWVTPPPSSTPDPTQGCVFSPLLYSLYTYDCKAMSESKVILKFTDGNAVVGLIPHNDETTSSPGGLVLEEPLLAECQQNKGADNGQQQRGYRSLSSVVQRQKVHTFKNLEVTVSWDLSWTHHINVVAKATRQHLYLSGGSETLSYRLKVLRNF